RDIGERNVTKPRAYADAAAFTERSLPSATRQEFEAGVNIESEVRGNDEIIVVGAHYDSVVGSPGADDNATGVAAIIELARRFGRLQPARTLRFVAFANEEPPHFGTPAMGSWQYARRCHERGEKIVAMLSLETIGYFSDAPKSQTYPARLDLIYPGTANFIAFVSNIKSRRLLRRCVRAFKGFPVESGSLPTVIPGVGWSDQWAFWEFGYRAVMVTDTAPFRNPHYHTASDRPETIDFARLAQVIDGLTGVIEELANAT
ncbi:MAG TPA: M20/M25/M40 family metallo-hydrolase, partial [Thermoanaerobaculia bacterium]|nr:M20/M25/M40 family metallo-hydrolase [Thermoanaerobaculia bacterium]